MDTLFVALRVLLSLAAVLGLVWYLQRRLSRGAKSPRVNPVSVVTKQAISPKASVVVIEVDGNRLVLGVTEHAVNVLQSAAVEAPARALTSVSPLPAAAFARSMDAAAGPTPDEQTEGSPRPTRRPAPVSAFAVTASDAPLQLASGSQFAGSILSPQTWKQAAATLRRSR